MTLLSAALVTARRLASRCPRAQCISVTAIVPPIITGGITSSTCNDQALACSIHWLGQAYDCWLGHFGVGTRGHPNGPIILLPILSTLKPTSKSITVAMQWLFIRP